MPWVRRTRLSLRRGIATASETRWRSIRAPQFRPIRKLGSPQPHCRRSGSARACIPAILRQARGSNPTAARWRSGTVDRSAFGSSGFRGMKMRREVLSGAGPRVGRSGTGALLGERRRVGRNWTMGFEPGVFVRPPLRLAWIELRARIGLCRCPAGSPDCQPSGGGGWDCRDGSVARSGWTFIATFAWWRSARTAGRGRRVGCRARRRGSGSLAESLLPTDRVAFEVTGSCWEVARILEPHVNRVVVVSPDDTGISSARAKTDKLDARTLASLVVEGRA